MIDPITIEWRRAKRESRDIHRAVAALYLGPVQAEITGLDGDLAQTHAVRINGHVFTRCEDTAILDHQWHTGRLDP